MRIDFVCGLLPFMKKEEEDENPNSLKCDTKVTIKVIYVGVYAEY